MTVGSINRRRRRLTRCGGWLATVMVIGSGTALICPYGKAACVLVLVVGLWIVIVWHRWMKQTGGVPVLIYHSVTSEGDWLPWSAEISVAPETFARHLETIRGLGCNVLRTSELVKALRSGRPLPERPLVIHFDDGYLDNWVAAFPALKRFGMPATVFVSLDFIEPGETPRPNLEDVEAGRCSAEELQWEGYLNWGELRLMQESGLVDIEAHGTDHGRVEVGPRFVDVLGSENWRRLAWVQWRAIPGNKSGWFRYAAPPSVPYGTLVRENQPALVSRAWHEGGRESNEEYEARVASELRLARVVLKRELNKEVQIFCWPFNAATTRAHELALEAGYLATTAGNGQNYPTEDPTVISRIHVRDRALGWKWSAFDSLAMRANIALFRGNYYWYLLVFPIDQCEKLVSVLRRRVRGGQR